MKVDEILGNIDFGAGSTLQSDVIMGLSRNHYGEMLNYAYALGL